MLRCYISRVENGHTVPSVEMLAKYALALDIPLYQIFYDGDEHPPKSQRAEPPREDVVARRTARDREPWPEVQKLKERDKVLVRLMVTKLVQVTR